MNSIKTFGEWINEAKRPTWKDSNAPDANGRFRDLGIKDLAKWLIRTRKGDMRKITGSLNQQIVFNRGDNPAYAKKMEKVRAEVKRQLGKNESVGWLNESAAPIPSGSMQDGLQIVQGLVDRGFEPKVASAIAGNMWQESKFKPTVSKATAPYIGLVQWGSPGGRKQKLLAKANWHTVDAQLDYVKHEFDTIPTFKSILPTVQAAPTLQKAAEIVARKYEGCADPTNPNRLNAAAQLYAEWNKTQTNFNPAQVDTPIDDAAFGEPASQI